ncbi:ROK family protein [Chitinophaga rhizophila]|uniref:ROK family protein n=1 Tax=Chitinophaga rhizophila TaxID=2866212 RepID=A0ABS7G7H9_9BACT|nr:ROK family protein [Chitinophaga rhizophila]MBW8683606.1 ROK family protein [Chitinophaga rhizophila]
MGDIILGVDIGGSHITTALVDVQQRALVPGSLQRIHVDAQADAADILDSWTAVMQQTVGNAGNIQHIGIAMPGPFDYESGISLIRGLHKYESLYGLNVKELLADRLHLPPSAITFANDAACFLQGELFAGVARGEQHALGLTLGTGFGSAIARDGVVQEGDFWKAPFLDTIAEEYISTRWFLRRYEALTGQKIASVKTLAALVPTSADARSVFEEFGGHLSTFLSQQADLPKLVVLGGNISQSYGLFQHTLQQHLPDTRFVVSQLGEDAILIGACTY